MLIELLALKVTERVLLELQTTWICLYLPLVLSYIYIYIYIFFNVFEAMQLFIYKFKVVIYFLE